MSDIAMAIIDGTGEYSDKAYADQMTGSFCDQLKALSGAHYERGPSGEGYYIKSRAERAANYLLKQKGKRLMIAGYSRGGSIAVMTASILKEKSRQVDLLLLFDPVNRHLSGDSSVIPSNVKEAYIARRRINDPEMDKYDYSLSNKTSTFLATVFLSPAAAIVRRMGDGAGHNPVRNWFGTTATQAHSSVKTHPRNFLGSHGALGGVGWKHVAEDPACQQRVASFMNEALKKHGVGVTLRSFPPK